MQKGLKLFDRETRREINWLDFEQRIYDETWHRVYTLFGIFKFVSSFKETNDLNKADNRKSRPISGFKNNK